MLMVDIPMPKNCIFCPMSHWNKLDEWTGCDAVGGKRFAATTDKEYSDMEGRPDWCPIKGEVVHSRWVYNEGDYVPYCENCLMPSDTETKYCSSCGAIMDSETEDEV